MRFQFLQQNVISEPGTLAIPQCTGTVKVGRSCVGLRVVNKYGRTAIGTEEHRDFPRLFRIATSAVNRTIIHQLGAPASTFKNSNVTRRPETCEGCTRMPFVCKKWDAICLSNDISAALVRVDQGNSGHPKLLNTLLYNSKREASREKSKNRWQKVNSAFGCRVQKQSLKVPI